MKELASIRNYGTLYVCNMKGATFLKVQMVDGHDIELYVYEPHAEIRIRGVIQLVHGSCEHVMRYEEFINFLMNQGYVVYANDHRGHGLSVQSADDFGYFGENDGWIKMVCDLKSVNDIIHAKHPDLPVIMFGHSMGSFLARHYAIDYGETINALILSGTAHQPGYQLMAGKIVAKLTKRIKGSKYRSPLIHRLSYGTFNQNIENAKTASDWICYDEQVVDEFCNDPKCGFVFTAAGFEDLFSGLLYITNPKNIKKMPYDLPTLLLSGKDDPVGGFGHMVVKANDAMKEAGLIDLNYKLYPNMRHEILNELDKTIVYDDIHDWIQQVI